MASGPAEGSPQQQATRFTENKVYTRKKSKLSSPNPNPIPARLTDDDVRTSYIEPVSAPAEPANDPVSKSVTISVSARPRNELRELRKRLMGELEQVRALSKRLDVAASAAAAAATPVAVQEAGYTQSQFSATDPETPVAIQQPPVFSKLTPQEVITPVIVPVITTPVTVPPPKAPVIGSVPFRRQLSVSLSDHLQTESLEKRTPKANQLYCNSDFLLAKDRIPPPELLKKPKSNGSKKHSLSSEIDNNEKKIYSNAFKRCSSLLMKLMKHKFGWVFNKPVDPVALQLHDYFKIITHPMDLGTIKTRLSKNWYKSPREYAEDVRLTLKNAMTYNPKGQDVHVMAEQLSQIFEEGWTGIETEMTYQLSYQSLKPSSLPPPVRDPRTLERSDSTVPVVPKVGGIRGGGALKKPKAKDMNKRDMTFEEKRRLSNNLQNLPQEKLDVVVQIIKRKNLSMSQHDDEIEVDIDSMDVETLWELDRFVTNYKKNLSKHKRKAELAMLANNNTNIRPLMQTTSANTTTRELTNRPGDEEGYVARPGVAVQEEKKGENGSSRSSSTSSSSSSGSSSSDSDSDTSSAYGSDAPQ